MPANIVPMGIRISNCIAGAPCGLRELHVHYQNTIFKMTTATMAQAPNGAGRSNQRRWRSATRGVSEYTNPFKVAGSGAAVARLTRMVTTKHTTQAKIAVQKFCAISLG